MTAIIAIAVNPAEQEKPYFLIASDSKRVLKQEDENGTLQTVQIDEDFNKIHVIKNRVLGIAGKIEDHFIEELITTLRDSDLNFEEFSKLAYDVVDDYIKSRSPFEFARCNIVIGENDNYKPKICQFLIIKHSDSSILNLETVEKGNALPVTLGNVEGMDDLFNNFRKRTMNAINFNSFVVKRAAKEYIIGVADRVPESCNKNIVFKKI